jgi:hypothetical protein
MTKNLEQKNAISSTRFSINSTMKLLDDTVADPSAVRCIKRVVQVSFSSLFITKASLNTNGLWRVFLIFFSFFFKVEETLYDESIRCQHTFTGKWDFGICYPLQNDSEAYFYKRYFLKVFKIYKYFNISFHLNLNVHL